MSDYYKNNYKEFEYTLGLDINELIDSTAVRENFRESEQVKDINVRKDAYKKVIEKKEEENNPGYVRVTNCHWCSCVIPYSDKDLKVVKNFSENSLVNVENVDVPDTKNDKITHTVKKARYVSNITELTAIRCPFCGANINTGWREIKRYRYEDFNENLVYNE